MKGFRGDTFFRNYQVITDDEIYIFKDTDKINLVFHNLDDNVNYLPKTVENIGRKINIDVTWSADEMQQLKIGAYILEVEIVTDEFVVTNQENIVINEDFIVGEENA